MIATFGHRQQCLVLVGLAAAAALLALAQGPAILRVPLGFLAVLVLPGYALTLVLIPSRDGMAWVARLSLGIALSIGLLTLAVLALDRTPWGLASGPIVVTVTGMAVVFALVAWFADRSTRAVRDAERRASPYPRAPILSPLTRRTLAALGLVALLVISLLAVVTNRPLSTTEFFVLGARGDAESYPRSLRIGEPAQVEIGITNREGSAQTYRVEPSGPGIEPVLLNAVTVEQGATFRQPVQLRATTPGTDRVLQIGLFRGGQTEPYRQLQLVVNVDGPA